MRMIIKVDNIDSEEVKSLIKYHFEKMREGSPIESVHALDISKLKSSDITFWTLWLDDELAGCGALKELNLSHGEIKSMRTYDSFFRKGVSQNILKHIISEAKKRGYTQLSLETGAAKSFSPAHNLYKKFGFIECEPFADYKEDPNCIFMTKYLD